MLTENQLAQMIVHACFRIHTVLGPGLLESVYEETLCYELRRLNLKFHRQFPVPVIYDEVVMDIGFRPDIIVENKVIIEIKSVESIAPVHQKQLLTYLKIMDLRLGLLVNFNQELIKHGIQRIVNRL